MTWRTLFSLVFLGLVSFLVLGCGNATINLTPQHFQNALLSISDQPQYDFGPVVFGSSTEHTFTVSNIGQADASQMTSGFYFSLHFKYKDGSYPGTGGTCSTDLGRDHDCTIVVVFEPAYNGSFQDLIAISYHNGVETASTTDPIIKGNGFGGPIGEL